MCMMVDAYAYLAFATHIMCSSTTLLCFVSANCHPLALEIKFRIYDMALCYYHALCPFCTVSLHCFAYKLVFNFSTITDNMLLKLKELIVTLNVFVFCCVLLNLMKCFSSQLCLANCLDVIELPHLHHIFLYAGHC